MDYRDYSTLQQILPKPLSVIDLFKKYKDIFLLSLLTNENTLNTEISSIDLHRPGLALAGFLKDYVYEHIQLLGHTEWNYLDSLGEEKRKEVFDKLKEYKSPMWILTYGLTPHKELLDMCETIGTPLFVTHLPTVDFARPLQRILEVFFAPKVSLHGSFIDIFGTGVLFVGESGVGKSECVLDLIEKGHCLVADDYVEFIRIGDYIIGKGKDNFNQYIEVHGAGIIDVRAIFGVRAVRKEKRLDIILELNRYKEEMALNRLETDSLTNKILGIKIPQTVIPIVPGKNITVISEVLAMDYLLKKEGTNSSKKLDHELIAEINKKIESKKCLLQNI